MEEDKEKRRITLESGEGRALKGEFSFDWGKKDDVEELRSVLSAVSDFLKELREPLEGLMKSLLGLIDGERVGGDVAAFYKKLRDAGVPEELAAEMTRKYFEQRISALNLLRKLGDLVSAGRGRTGRYEGEASGRE